MGCPVECTAPGANKRSGCPTCKWRIRYKAFEAKCQELFKRLHGYRPQDDREWTIDHLIGHMTVAIRAAGQTKRGYDRTWTVTLSKMVDIYRDESSRMSSVDSWNHRQEMKTMLEGLRDERKGHRDPDEFDEPE